MTLEPRGYGYCPSTGQTPLRTNRSPALILLITSITSPTAVSATSSENTVPALHTEIPRRRHSGRSMWLTPALEITMIRTAGSFRSRSAVTGVSPEHIIACTEPQFSAKNWSVGTGDSKGLRNWNLWQKCFPWTWKTSGGPRSNTLGRCLDSAMVVKINNFELNKCRCQL